MESQSSAPLIAIACGGTGGHLFPGLAVAEVLQLRGCNISLLVSHKEVDQHAVQTVRNMEIVTLPAVALQDWEFGNFMRGSWKSFRLARAIFGQQKPQAVLAMGSFTSAPPILAGKAVGAATFLHEANAVPGKANRWLSPFVDQAFVAFPEAANRLPSQAVKVTGMPVRSNFQPMDPGACRMALGLDPNRPMLLIMGGSQGASGINQALVNALPRLLEAMPDIQFLHLTGTLDLEKVRSAYAAFPGRGRVMPFLTEMDLALGAATAVISRAGASSLAELAAMQIPALLVPFPAAADNHQFYNARAFAKSGAARVLEQAAAKPEVLVKEVCDLMLDAKLRAEMVQALGRWHASSAAEVIANEILKVVGEPTAGGAFDFSANSSFSKGGKSSWNQKPLAWNIKPSTAKSR